jgi:hypothetical protein
MPTTVLLYPHAVSRLLEFRILDPWDPAQEGLEFGKWFKPEARDESLLTIDLSREDVPAWRSLHLTLEANLPIAELTRILPEGSSTKDNTILLVSIHCPATMLRQVVVLGFVADGRWRGDVTLRKNDVRGTVRFRCRLVRRTGIPDTAEDEGAPVARHRAAIVAEAPRDLSLVVDESHRPIGGPLRIRWEDFRRSDNSWRHDHPADVFHLEPYGSEPTLWLNARYEKLRAALHSRTAYGADAAVRYLGNALLAQTAWVQLFIASLASATKDETLDAVEFPPEAWKRGVLNKFLPRMFPEMPDSDRLAHAFDELTSPDQVGSVVSLLGTAAQDVMATYRQVESAIRAAEHSRGGES